MRHCLFLQIILYCGGHPLGSAVVSLQSLLGGDQQFTLPAAIEALFPLESPGQERVGETNEVPGVGVSVVLKYEETSVSATELSNQPLNADNPGSNQVQVAFWLSSIS